MVFASGVSGVDVGVGDAAEFNSRDGKVEWKSCFQRIVVDARNEERNGRGRLRHVCEILVSGFGGVSARY
ncbi:hypothetical protein AAC387_Pa04g1146 [Persea americana]